MRSRIPAIMRKEFITVRRDSTVIANVFVLPLVMMLIYGYGIRFDIRELPTAIYDLSRTPESRDLISAVVGSGYFRRVADLTSTAEVDTLFEQSKIKVALVIPPRYATDVGLGKLARVQVLVDGSDANTATLAVGYLEGIIAKHSGSLLGEKFEKAGIHLPFEIPAVTQETRLWYNPEQKSVNFIVPGIIVVMMSLLGALMTTMTIVGEKERGTMEQIVASPVTSTEFMVGKIVPYMLLAMTALALIVSCGYLVFGVPVKGSILLLTFFAFLFVTCALGLGLLVSTLASSLQVGMMLAMLITLLPSILLSGFIFPIESMPPVLQGFSRVVPGRYFLEALRGIYLKGVGLGYLWPQALFLAGMGTLLLWVSTKKFRKRLD